MNTDPVRSKHPQAAHRGGELGKLHLTDLLDGVLPGGPVLAPGHSKLARLANSDVSLEARQPETAVDAVLLEVNLLEVPEPHAKGVPVHREAAQGEMLDGQVGGDGEPGGKGKDLCLLDAVLVEVLAVPDLGADFPVALATKGQSS